MDQDRFDFLIIGGGIVGLATAVSLVRKYPRASIGLIEKENRPAFHQTGHNSGVIHSGIYYKPNSLKARFATAGNESMQKFCYQHGIRYEVCGKIIVATSENEIDRLHALHQRGLDHGLAVTWLEPAAVREFEPAVSCIAAVRVPSTGIVDYTEVANQLLALFIDCGGRAFFDTELKRAILQKDEFILETNQKGQQSEFRSRFLINCAGLFSDRVAQKSGEKVATKIVPFRGEYYELVKEKSSLVRGMVYPVPNPNFPFLGVHLTRSIDGKIHAGPNAVLAWKREGYTKQDVDLFDLLDTITFPGFWTLSRKHFGEGFAEMRRSWMKSFFLASLQRLVPDISGDDLVAAPAGVRAQALQADGMLVDDFAIVASKNAIHVLNAPSPAATSSLEIGQEIVKRIPEHAHLG